MRSRTVVVALLVFLMAGVIIGCDDTRHGVVLAELPSLSSCQVLRHINAFEGAFTLSAHPFFQGLW
jgi:hypothetical protein